MAGLLSRQDEHRNFSGHDSRHLVSESERVRCLLLHRWLAFRATAGLSSNAAAALARGIIIRGGYFLTGMVVGVSHEEKLPMPQLSVAPALSPGHDGHLASSLLESAR